MSKLSLIIVDDESLARDRLRRLLHDVTTIEIVAEADNGATALQLVDQHQPDVVLLDIRMPGMDGMEAARHMAQLHLAPAVIFTTAYGEHALEAFETHALDYLLKPIRRERLIDALQHATRLTQAKLDTIQEVSSERRRHICARVRGNLELIAVETIRYFQAEQKYVVVHHAGGEVLIEDPLKALEHEFAGDFIRIHRNALISVAHIVGLERDREGHCYLRIKESDDLLEISRRHLSEVRKLVQAL